MPELKGQASSLEFRFKAFTVWLDLKMKIATTAILANAGLLATTFAFVKDKGPDNVSLFVLQACLYGILAGCTALVVVWSYANGLLEDWMKGADSSELARPFTLRSATIFGLIFYLFVAGSGACFLFSIAYYLKNAHAIVDVKKESPPKGGSP